jgi:hypothetical protein
MRRNGKWVSLLVMIVAASGVLCSPGLSLAAEEGNSAISVERDKEKTTYIIRGCDKERQKEETDRVWDMLHHVIVDTRGRHGTGPDNNR